MKFRQCSMFHNLANYKQGYNGYKLGIFAKLSDLQSRAATFLYGSTLASRLSSVARSARNYVKFVVSAMQYRPTDRYWSVDTHRSYKLAYISCELFARGLQCEQLAVPIQDPSCHLSVISLIPGRIGSSSRGQGSVRYCVGSYGRSEGP